MVLLQTLIALQWFQHLVDAPAVFVEALQVFELVAALSTLEHLDVGVCDHVSVERVAAGEALPTFHTHMGALPCVHAAMVVVIPNVRELLTTISAAVWPEAKVNALVAVVAAAPGERLLADFTGVWFDSIVESHVRLEVGAQCKPLVTLITFKGFVTVLLKVANHI